MRSAILFKMMLLSVAEVFPQVSNAFAAVSTASSKSSFVECATCVNTFPSKGEILSKYLPNVGGTNSPPM